MIKFAIAPDSSGYTVRYGAEGAYTRLNGGANRYGITTLNSTYNIRCQWSCNREAYKYIKLFYRSIANYGATPFLIDLILTGSTLIECKAYFVPSTLALKQQRGDLYVVTAELEAASYG